MIRFFNGRVLSFAPEATISSAEVWTDGAIISYFGPEIPERPVFDREINLKGNLLIPGLKNAHAHTAMTFVRSASDNKPLDRWLNEDIFPIEAKLTDELVYTFTKIGILEYLRGGITSAFDMYFHLDAYCAACTEYGFRSVICSAMNNFDQDPTSLERDYLKYNSFHDLISFQLGVHAEYTTSEERLKYAASLGEKYKAPLYTHLSETNSEVQGCISRHGMTPPRYLDSLGFFNYGGGGFHCVHFTPEDWQLFREKQLYAVHCPASNLKLGSGIANVSMGGETTDRWALGTDGAASNNALDLFREMYLTSTLQTFKTGNPAAISPSFILKMACSNGANAMNLPECNNIAIGKKADLAVINLQLPNMQPENNLISNLVYAGKVENVSLTMINGRILYENGEYAIGEDPEKLYLRANEQVKELVEHV